MKTHLQPKTDTMQIYDNTSGTIIEIKDPKKRAYSFPEPDGEERSVDGIYFTVVGRNREWPLWISMEDFNKYNQNINIDELLS